MTVIELRSDHLVARLDPDRGGELQWIARPGGANALAHHVWDAPLAAGPGPHYGSTELDWLSRYQAGWQVLFPNAGAESIVDGVPVAFHGELSLARLRVVETRDDACVLEGAARLPLHLIRRIALLPGRSTLRVEEIARNIGSRPVPFLWGHHPTFPALPGARIDLAGARLEVEPATPGALATGSGSWPWLREADGRDVDVATVPADEQVRLLYAHDLMAPWVALRQPANDPAPSVALAWDEETFPCLWIWLQNADPGFPWYGRARMIGLEPQRAWPFDGLGPAVARGQALRLEPGEERSSWVELTVLDDAEREVRSVARGGGVTYAA